MKKDIDKPLVLITAFIFSIILFIIFSIDLFYPKKLDTENALRFGNNNSSIKIVVFEDFKCKYCKDYINKIFPQIETYINDNKISYSIVPLAYIYGSQPIASAAISVYELNKSKFFEFLRIISDKKTFLDSKQDLMDVARNLDGINLNIYKDFIDKDVFKEYLKNNLLYAKKTMKGQIEVPSIYLNGKKVSMHKLKLLIDAKLKKDSN
ncbi:MAG: thioredoxin domain-containing protein [Parachlamydiales bacterium]|jgi:protein-disulfide isomerase